MAGTTLENRIAVVTGAASGIGRELVLALSTAGARTVAVGKDGQDTDGPPRRAA